MKHNAKIKVIKKNKIIITKPPIITEENLKETATREQALTVSDWINEFQTRRGEETKQSYNKLFTQRLQTI